MSELEHEHADDYLKAFHDFENNDPVEGKYAVSKDGTVELPKHQSAAEEAAEESEED